MEISDIDEKVLQVSEGRGVSVLELVKAELNVKFSSNALAAASDTSWPRCLRDGIPEGSPIACLKRDQKHLLEEWLLLLCCR